MKPILKKTKQLKLAEVPLAKARELFSSYRLDDEAMVKVIAEVWENTEYLLDPHTAVGVEAARKTRRRNDIPMVCLATAHPAKFPEAVRQAGYPKDPDLPHHMTDLFTREERYEIRPNDIAAVHQFMAANIVA